jgi:hypothetical protein
MQRPCQFAGVWHDRLICVCRIEVELKILAACILLSCGVHATASAEPGYYLIPTYENAGEKSVDFKLWSVKIPGDPRVTGPEIGLAWGVTRAWYSEVTVGYVRAGESGTRRSDLNWQNDFLLTHGQWPVDVALHTNVKKYRAPEAGSALEYFAERRGYNVEFGPILQTDIGRLQLNGNLLFDRDYRGEEANKLQMKYQWQVKYRWLPQLQVGLQGFGELGDWDHWAARHDQSHRAGPAVFGSMPVAGQTLKYEAAYLTGKIFAEHANIFSMRVQLVF